MQPGGADQCAYADAVRLRAEKDAIALAPASVAPSCPVVAALKLWEWQVVQPAAQRIYGQPVQSVRHLGSYSCRRMYGRSEGDFSEHATADALDVAGFTLADGRSISVLRDWKGEGEDNSCARYATAHAICFRPCCHPIIMPRTATISTSIRPSEGQWGDGPVADLILLVA